MCEGGLEASFLHHVAPHLTQLNPNLLSDTDIFELVHGFFAFYGNTNFSERRLNPIKGEMEAKTTTWDKTAALDIINPLGKYVGIIQNFLIKGAPKGEELRLHLMTYGGFQVTPLNILGQ